MDSLDLQVRTATIGELACGCPFERKGTYRIGDWIPCDAHHAPAPVATSSRVLPDGLIAPHDA